MTEQVMVVERERLQPFLVEYGLVRDNLDNALDAILDGHFFLDPCNLHEGEAAMVADRILDELARARTSHPGGKISAAERRVRRFERLLRWPD